jgi:putative flavoprotein involved in K+ transport
VKSGVDIERLTERGVRFVDETEINADIVIQATGFQSLHETIAQIVSREAGDRIGKCWGLGSGTRNDSGPWHGEPRNMYKPVAHENIWIQGGNLALSRFFSKFVALQIKARMEGIETPVYGAPTCQSVTV